MFMKILINRISHNKYILKELDGDYVIFVVFML